jgi:glycosyltransferase involved in cell wall biosynthesis
VEPELGIVVPVYRNAATLAALHERTARALDGRVGSWELVFVDDACPAGSGEVLRGLVARDPRLSAVFLERNLGQNRAVLVGLACARGRTLVVMDGDLQDPPEAIPRLLDALRGEIAAVFAGRRGRYESGLRLLSSRAFKRALWLLSGGRLPPDAGLFVAMRRDLAQRVLELAGPEPYVVGLIARAGLPLASIPVERSARAGGESAYDGRARLRLAWRALRQSSVAKGPGARPSVSWRSQIREVAGARFEGAR